MPTYLIKVKRKEIVNVLLLLTTKERAQREDGAIAFSARYSVMWSAETDSETLILNRLQTIICKPELLQSDGNSAMQVPLWVDVMGICSQAKQKSNAIEILAHPKQENHSG